MSEETREEKLVLALLKLRRGAVLADEDEERNGRLDATWVIITVDEALKVEK